VFGTIAPAWRQPLALLAVMAAALLTLFWRDTAHLASIWWTSSTFSHCLLILPILGWLVWLRSGELAQLAPRPWAGGLIWMAGGAVAWLLGEAAGVALARQLGLIVMLQALVPTLLGPQITRGLLFPFLYSLFLVPVGEELVPPMQALTADMSMALLRLVGVPAYIEGIFITTPAGLFAVAEACSGVKFLIAMASLAVLTAHLCFTSWTRRAVFLIVALIVPVIANGFRAFSTIWIAEYWGVEFAASADHVIYGWVFFGLVIAIVGAIFWRWFDREPDDVPISAAELRRSYAGGRVPLWAGAIGVAVMALAPVLWLTRVPMTPPNVLHPAALTISGWTNQDAASDWRPRFDGAALVCRGFTAVGGAGRVDLCVARYPWQEEGRELVGYGQGAVDPDGNWRWSEDLAPIGPMRVEHIASAHHRAVASLYAVGDVRTASATGVKWATLRARLLNEDQRATALLISARAEDGGRAAIARFLDAAGSGDALLARLTARP
jgi:exosortase A